MDLNFAQYSLFVVIRMAAICDLPRSFKACPVLPCFTDEEPHHCGEHRDHLELGGQTKPFVCLCVALLQSPILLACATTDASERGIVI